jgi:hypothetical protein
LGDEDEDEDVRRLTVRVEELAALVANGGERSCGDKHGQFSWKTGFGSKFREEGCVESEIVIRLCRDMVRNGKLVYSADERTKFAERCLW